MVPLGVDQEENGGSSEESSTNSCSLLMLLIDISNCNRSIERHRMPTITCIISSTCIFSLTCIFSFPGPKYRIIIYNHYFHCFVFFSGHIFNNFLPFGGISMAQKKDFPVGFPIKILSYLNDVAVRRIKDRKGCRLCRDNCLKNL